MTDLLVLGRIVATTGALAACEKAGTDPQTFLKRHAQGDRGELGCLSANGKGRGRVKSSYPLPNGETVWIMTDPDPSTTLLLLPQEF